MSKINKEEHYGHHLIDYEKSKREYSPKMFDDIREYAELNKESRLLEIGAATGAATDGFKDYRIDVLEITEEQVAYLRNKYKNNPLINVILKRFEDYNPDNLYDMLYAGTSFHWIDSKIGYAKAGKLLKSGGTIALFWNLAYGIKGEGAYGKCQDIEMKYGISLVDKTEDFCGKTKFLVTCNLVATKMFNDINAQIYKYTKRYDLESYLSWVRSRYYTYAELTFEEKQGYESEIEKVFKDNFGEIDVEQEDLLIIAKRI